MKLQTIFSKAVYMLGLCSFIISTPLHAKTLEQYFKNVKTLSAKFEQSVFNQSNQEQENSKGSIAVSSPNKFRLEYHAPYKQVYVADGQKLWSYDEDLEQVTVRQQQNQLANSPAIVLSNPSNLSQAYTVKHQGKDKGIDWFYLTPKSSDSGFDQVRLGFSGNNLFLMEMYDTFGQTTLLRFSELHYNPTIKPDTFVFTAPQGVDVIGETDLPR